MHFEGDEGGRRQEGADDAWMATHGGSSQSGLVGWLRRHRGQFTAVVSGAAVVATLVGFGAFLADRDQPDSSPGARGSPTSETTDEAARSDGSAPTDGSGALAAAASDPPSETETLRFEAEDAELTAPMRAESSFDASGGALIYSDVTNQGAARIDFEIEVGGQYWIWGRVSAGDDPNATTDANSLAVSLDGQTVDVWDFFENESLPSIGLRWERVSVRCAGDFDNHFCDPWQPRLDPGPHTLTLLAREPLSRLDVLVLTNDEEYVPDQ
ncbi:MAG: hypothetical protein AAFZ07_12305 [Actinomycetota bacterium]